MACNGIWRIAISVLFVYIHKRFQRHRSVIVQGFGAAQRLQQTTIGARADPPRSDMK